MDKKLNDYLNMKLDRSPNCFLLRKEISKLLLICLCWQLVCWIRYYFLSVQDPATIIWGDAHSWLPRCDSHEGIYPGLALTIEVTPYSCFDV